MLPRLMCVSMDGATCFFNRTVSILSVSIFLNLSPFTSLSPFLFADGQCLKEARDTHYFFILIFSFA